MTGQDPGQPDLALMLAMQQSRGRRSRYPEVAIDLCPTVRPTHLLNIGNQLLSLLTLCSTLMVLQMQYRTDFVSHTYLLTETCHQSYHSTQVAEKHEVVQKSSERTENHTEPLFLSPTEDESDLFC